MQVRIHCSRCGADATIPAFGATGEQIINTAQDHFVSQGWKTDASGDLCPNCVRILEGLTDPVVTINWVDDEHVEIKVNGQVVVDVNHDEHGWDGVHAVIKTATAVAKAAGLRVETIGIPNL